MRSKDRADLAKNGEFYINGQSGNGPVRIIFTEGPHAPYFIYENKDQDREAFIFDRKNGTDNLKRFMDALIEMDPEGLKDYTPREIRDEKVTKLIEDIKITLYRLDGLSMADTVPGEAIRGLKSALQAFIGNLIDCYKRTQ